MLASRWRGIFKWFLRLLTRKCELERVCELERFGAARTCAIGAKFLFSPAAFHGPFLQRNRCGCPKTPLVLNLEKIDRLPYHFALIKELRLYAEDPGTDVGQAVEHVLNVKQIVSQKNIRH